MTFMVKNADSPNRMNSVLLSEDSISSPGAAAV